MLKMAVNIAVFGAFVLMVAVLGFFLWQTLFATEENSKAEGQPKITYSEKQTGNENPLGTSAVPSVANPGDKAIVRYTKWLAIFTLFLVLATIGLFVSGERAVRVANRSAKAAQKSAEIAERALIAGQRAFISAVLMGIAAKNVETDQVVQWNFTTTWNNAGTTPTRDMRNHISVKMFDGPLPNDWDFPDLWTKNVTSKTPTLLTGPAKGAVQGQTVGAFTVDQIREVINGKKTLYMWGWASYNDVFPSTPRHVTRFAVQIFAGGNPTDPNRMTFNFSYLDRYNCSDGECEGQGRLADWKARDLVE
jgi:hypothetical protein